jgi:hypothetical protein
MWRRATEADRKWNLPVTYMIGNSFSGRKTLIQTIFKVYSGFLQYDILIFLGLSSALVGS